MEDGLRRSDLYFAHGGLVPRGGPQWKLLELGIPKIVASHLNYH
jgi:hypothetical protein